MHAEDIVALMVPVTFLAMMAIEVALRNGRRWPDIPWWHAKGLAFFLMLMTINAALPSLVPPEFAQHHAFQGASLGVVGGALVGYPCVALVTALLHRAYHRYPVLWRLVHQLHHAPQRVDMPGAVLFTPLEVVINVTVSFALTVFVLGLDTVAAAVVGYLAAFYGMFQHLNVRTPRWLGYFIQRPESHCVHHRRGLHAYNYSDFPLWDMVFGTFRNPERFQGDVGFERAESMRIGAMLMGRDVNAASLGARSRGCADPESNPA